MNIFAICGENDQYKQLLAHIAKTETAFSLFSVKYYASPELLLREAENGQNPAAVLLSMEPDFGTAAYTATQLNQICPRCRIILHSKEIKNYFTAYQAPHSCFIQDDDLEAFLPQEINRLLMEIAEPHAVLAVKYRGKEQLVDYASILYLQHSARSTYVVLTNGQRLVTKQDLDQASLGLPSPPFWRCHKSYCINWQYVKAFRRECYIMNNDDIIPISRSRQETSRAAFKAYLQSHRAAKPE